MGTNCNQRLSLWVEDILSFFFFSLYPASLVFFNVAFNYLDRDLLSYSHSDFLLCVHQPYRYSSPESRTMFSFFALCSLGKRKDASVLKTIATPSLGRENPPLFPSHLQKKSFPSRLKPSRGPFLITEMEPSVRVYLVYLQDYARPSRKLHSLEVFLGVCVSDLWAGDKPWFHSTGN